MEEFDSYIANEEETYEGEGSKSVDEAIAKEHILGVICPGKKYFDGLEDFQQGGQEQDLSLVAQNNWSPPQFTSNYTPISTHAAEGSSMTTRPIGFCVDICAQRSVISELEFSLLLKHLDKLRGSLRSSANSFHFADATYQSLGTTSLPLKTPHHVDTIFVELYIVSANVPAFLVLDAMDSLALSVHIDKHVRAVSRTRWEAS